MSYSLILLFGIGGKVVRSDSGEKVNRVKDQSLKPYASTVFMDSQSCSKSVLRQASLLLILIVFWGSYWLNSGTHEKEVILHNPSPIHP